MTQTIRTRQGVPQQTTGPIPRATVVEQISEEKAADIPVATPLVPEGMGQQIPPLRTQPRGRKRNAPNTACARCKQSKTQCVRPNGRQQACKRCQKNGRSRNDCWNATQEQAMAYAARKRAAKRNRTNDPSTRCLRRNENGIQCIRFEAPHPGACTFLSSSNQGGPGSAASSGTVPPSGPPGAASSGAASATRGSERRRASNPVQDLDKAMANAEEYINIGSRGDNLELKIKRLNSHKKKVNNARKEFFYHRINDKERLTRAQGLIKKLKELRQILQKKAKLSKK